MCYFRVSANLHPNAVQCIQTRRVIRSQTGYHHHSPHYFLDAPKFALAFLSFESVSLSSALGAFTTFFNPVPVLFVDVADVGVAFAVLEAMSLRKDVLIGVGA